MALSTWPPRRPLWGQDWLSQGPDTQLLPHLPGLHHSVRPDAMDAPPSKSASVVLLCFGTSTSRGEQPLSCFLSLQWSQWDACWKDRAVGMAASSPHTHQNTGTLRPLHTWVTEQQRATHVEGRAPRRCLLSEERWTSTCSVCALGGGTESAFFEAPKSAEWFVTKPLPCACPLWDSKSQAKEMFPTSPSSLSGFALC